MVLRQGLIQNLDIIHPIPDNMVRNAEIQCIVNPPDNPYITSEEFNEITSYIQNNTEHFFVDQSIFTFHSPDIEFDDRIKSVDSSNLKLRIVGLVPITSTISDIDIQTLTPKLDSKRPGFYKENLGTENLSNIGSKSMNSGGFWIDSASASAVPLKHRDQPHLWYILGIEMEV